MPTEFIEKDSDAKEKFTKQLLFGSTRAVRQELGFIWLLRYCVSLNKTEGCELDHQPLPNAFIRHLLLSSGGNVERLLGGFDHKLSQINTLQFDRCDQH